MYHGRGRIPQVQHKLALPNPQLLQESIKQHENVADVLLSPGGKVAAVSLLQATGATVLQRMLYFSPSRASVLHKPSNAILAAE